MIHVWLNNVEDLPLDHEIEVKFDFEVSSSISFDLDRILFW